MHSWFEKRFEREQLSSPAMTENQLKMTDAIKARSFALPLFRGAEESAGEKRCFAFADPCTLSPNPSPAPRVAGEGRQTEGVTVLLGNGNRRNYFSSLRSLRFLL